MGKKILIFLIVLLQILESYAQESKIKPSILPKKFYSEFELERTVNGLVVVNKVKVEEKKQAVKFIFDTGSTLSYISSKLAEEIGFKPLFKDSVFDGYTYKAIDFGVIDLKIDNISFKDIIVGVDDDFFYNDSIDGMIGFNMMKLCAWQFDTYLNKITIMSSAKDKMSIDFSYEQSLGIINKTMPFVMCAVKGEYGTYFIDLGDNSTIVFPEKGINRCKKSAKYLEGKGSVVQTSFQISIDTAYINKRLKYNKFYFTEFKRAEIKNTTHYLSNVLVEVDEYAQSATIGAGILNYYIITIDFPKQKFYSELIKRDFDLKSFGFGIYPNETNNKYFISTVWNNSEAYNKNIKPNDEVLEINNTALTTQKVSIMYQWIKDEMEKDKILMKIKDREGKIREVYLEKKELIFND